MKRSGESQRLADEDDTKFLPSGLTWNSVSGNSEQGVPPVRLRRSRNHDVVSAKSVEHWLVEADNLLALRALQKEIHGAVDLIYIDPPYNTGNKSLSYSDTRRSGSQMSHSAWLDFMEPRLRLAWDLLADEGVFAISIDNHEQPYLRLLCDGLFGADKLLGQFVWHRTNKGKALSKQARDVVDYVLIYSKNPKRRLYGERANPSVWNPLIHGPNRIRKLEFPRNTISISTDKSVIPAGRFGEGRLAVELLRPVKVSNGLIASKMEVAGRFRWTQGNLDAHLADGTRFNATLPNLRLRFIAHDVEKRWKAPRTIWDSKEAVGTSEEATAELAAIIGPGLFTYPKPLGLLRYIMQIAFGDRRDGLVLDFFAGSGTTLHAVLEANAEDHGARRCILVTNNEEGICRNVTLARAEAVITGDWHDGPHEPLRGTLRFFEAM